jgi:hypothetical protein
VGRIGNSLSSVVVLDVQDTASADIPSRSSKSGANEIDAAVLIDDVQIVDNPERLVVPLDGTAAST